jgi:hypothetical protein
VPQLSDARLNLMSQLVRATIQSRQLLLFVHHGYLSCLRGHRLAAGLRVKLDREFENGPQHGIFPSRLTSRPARRSAGRGRPHAIAPDLILCHCGRFHRHRPARAWPPAISGAGRWCIDVLAIEWNGPLCPDSGLNGRSTTVSAVTNWSGRQGRRGCGRRCWPRYSSALKFDTASLDNSLNSQAAPPCPHTRVRWSPNHHRPVPGLREPRPHRRGFLWSGRRNRALLTSASSGRPPACGPYPRLTRLPVAT